MNLPKLPFLEKKEKSEYFLSLVLRDEKVSAVVFKESNTQVNVVGEHSVLFKTTLEEANEEELLDAIDRSVSTAEKSLPEGVESQKTIFGLKEDWIHDGKIKPHYLAKLKKISDDLQFKPVGFLVITEALIHELQAEEGAPVSAIICEIGKKNVTVSLAKAGKLLETKNTAIGEESIPDTVDALLKHFTTAEVLPSRIIIFDNGSEKLAQGFIAHKWSRELGFLHVPQVTNLPANFDAKAVLAGAASQMGFEVLEASLIRAEKIDAKDTEEIGGFEAFEEDKTLAEAASEFGFSSADVAEKPKTAVDESVAKSVKSDNLAVAQEIKELPEEEKILDSDSRPLPVNAAAMGLSMKAFFSKIKVGNIFKSVSGNKKKLLFLIIPLVLLVVLIGFYALGRSATVTLGVNSKETEKSETVTLSESDPTNASDNTINVKFVTSTQDGKTTTAATGKKETGDKAKGTVTIFNSDTSGGKTISAGTVIVSSNDLKFVTDKAVTVASASGDIFSGTEPGKADIAVTAEKFGTNYNLPSNTKFTVEGSSEIAAKNDKAFSGGTKKDIKVVSQKDLDKLTKDLQENLKESAKADIEKQASGNAIVFPEFTAVEYDKKSFSKKLDEEANEVSLTGTIAYEGVTYQKDDLVKYAKEKLAEDIPSDMMIDEETVTGEASEIEQDDDETTAEVTVKASLVPKIDPEQIAKDIAGKSVKSSTAKLQGIPEVERVNIKVFINLPLLPNILPFSSEKIKVVVDKNG